MTKCRSHPYERGVGVCAACLRDRLLIVIAAREGAQSPELHWNLDPSPPPLLRPLEFPQSVSPYAGRRRHRHPRFFSTPQVGPTFDYERNLGGAAAAYAGRKKRSSVLSLLFGSSTGSRSWFLDLFSSRRRKTELPDRTGTFPEFDRGMSPDRDYDAESVCSSGYNTESSAGWRRPEPTPVRRFPAASPGRGGIGVSGIAMCLSPLVRPNPKPAADAGFSGDLRCGTEATGRRNRRQRRQVPTGEGALGPSRSRKLADIGRFR
ncbi:uncharacterized protein M6B38_167270 [Iris pallida]|uniref:Uncharacterized protein n=1 Tax=Iris pallida TaxID=29817 RepID=A0AAX6EWR8_IRIPA|nr:uncharacterized protein M6B38_167270 [Iris pallida]